MRVFASSESLDVDWHKVQAISQNGIDALTHVLGNIGTLSNIGIPLVSSVSGGFVLGMVRG
jgi:hypothetical protein